jgi:antirestriction protein
MKKTIATVATIASIFITDLAAYNAGELRGEWVDLPCDCDELDEIIDRISCGGEHELFITDWESDLDGLEIGEYENITELNERLQALDDLDEYEKDIAAAILEAGAARDISEAVSMIDDCILYSECETLTDLAYELVDDGSFFGDAIPDNLRNYIDYDAIARDLGYDNYYETSHGVLYVG